MRDQRTFLSVLTIIFLLATAKSSSFAEDAKEQTPAKLPTLFIIGDSTVKNSTKGLQGWGTPIATLFDPTKITVENRALGGRSSRTYRTEGLWDQTLAKMKPGDFVLMQFGHNDGGGLTRSMRASLKGNGEETQEVTDEKTGKKEIVHTYGWYMRQYAKEAKAKGAIPIVLSQIPRNMWKDDKVLRASNDYGKWAAEAAKAEGAAFVDLNDLVAKKYEVLGEEKVKSLYFLEDHTHTTPAGALVNAQTVVEGVRGVKECPLGAYVNGGGKASIETEK